MYLSIPPPSHYSSALKCFSQCIRAQETWLKFTGLLLYWIKGMFLSCLTWSTWIFTAQMFGLLKLKERKPATWLCLSWVSTTETGAKNNQTECRMRSRTGLQQLAGLCDNLRVSLCLTSDGTLRELAELGKVR